MWIYEIWCLHQNNIYFYTFKVADTLENESQSEQKLAYITKPDLWNYR